MPLGFQVREKEGWGGLCETISFVILGDVDCLREILLSSFLKLKPKPSCKVLNSLKCDITAPFWLLNLICWNWLIC